MIFILVPAWIAAGVAIVWILTRRSWPWWVRIPGCVVLAPVAAFVGWIVFAVVLIGVMMVVAWFRDGTISWPW